MSKRYNAIAAKVDRNKHYPLNDALKLVKETAVAKFDESIDVSVNLSTTEPRTNWSDFFASMPRFTETSIDSSNFAVAFFLASVNASANA